MTFPLHRPSPSIRHASLAPAAAALLAAPTAHAATRSETGVGTGPARAAAPGPEPVPGTRALLALGVMGLFLRRRFQP